MESILHELFTGEYTAYPPRDAAQNEIGRRKIAYEDKIQETFGLDFLDELNTILAESDNEHDYACFRAGFLLGTRLMLEVLDTKS